MSIGVSEASLSDIAAVTNNRNNDGMFGNDWAWIVIILLFGWGRNGFGGCDEVAFVFAVFVINDDDELPLSEVLNGQFNVL